MTREEFISNAIRIHGNVYDYSKIEYCKKVTDKVTIICPEHGEFKQDYLHHVQRKQKCKKCSDIEKGLKHRLDTSTFIKHANEKHNFKYDYSKSNYISSKEKVCIICPEHGEFLQLPNLHLFGEGCPKCKAEKIKNACKYDTSIFINKCKEIYGNRYSYENTHYVDSRHSVIITCPEHGDFHINPSSFLLHKKGCSKCAYEKYNKSHTVSYNEFVKRAKSVHGDLYDYADPEYTNITSYTNIICKKHGKYRQLAFNHINGKGCPVCNFSKLELDIKNMLEKNNILFEMQKTFDWLFYKLPMKLDFYLPEYNIAIECQGIQHFQCLNFFGGSKEFEKIKEKDFLKKELCNKHNIKILYYSNLTDIEFPYNVFTDKQLLLNSILN